MRLSDVLPMLMDGLPLAEVQKRAENEKRDQRPPNVIRLDDVKAARAALCRA